MSREKQVDEMANAMCNLGESNCQECANHWDFVTVPKCDLVKRAERLYNAGYRKQNWISVEERLPKYNTTVLVYRPTMAEKIITDTYYGWYGEDDERWYEGWSLYGKNLKGENVITHWMPIPKPPKGE